MKLSLFAFGTLAISATIFSTHAPNAFGADTLIHSIQIAGTGCPAETLSANDSRLSWKDNVLTLALPPFAAAPDRIACSFVFDLEAPAGSTWGLRSISTVYQTKITGKATAELVATSWIQSEADQAKVQSAIATSSDPTTSILSFTDMTRWAPCDHSRTLNATYQARFTGLSSDVGAGDFIRVGLKDADDHTGLKFEVVYKACD